jgi:hypothetical protein
VDIEQWNSLIQNIKPSIEVLSFITNIFLFATVIIGIKQLRMVKDDNHTRNERAAKEKSIEYLKWFSSEYVLEINDFVQKLNASNISKYKGPITSAFKYDDNLDNQNVNRYIRYTVNNDANELLNKLEYFSVGVVSGIADKKILERPLARPFVSFVILMYPTICWSRRHDDSTYSGLVELFNEWIMIVTDNGELKIKDNGEIISNIQYKYGN